MLPGIARALPPNGVCGGGKSTALLTVTDRVAVLVFPAASRATALRVCAPLATPLVFHDTEYGEEVSSPPILLPSTLNCTPATPTLSDAVADTVTVLLTVAPLAGAENEMVGCVVSAGATLFTLTVRDAVLVLPAASRASTWMVWL